MTSVHAKAFRGQTPRIDPRLIGANFARTALNCKLTSGRLEPLKGLDLVFTSTAAAITTMYRYRHQMQDNWLVWGSVVDVVRSPTAQDALGRLFYTGDGEPRMTTYADAISGGGPYPTAFYTLGVYIPEAAASLAVVGGGAPVETRSYVYTFRTRYGEESATSLPVVASGNANGSWNLSNMELPPVNSGTVSAAATIATGVVRVTMNTVRGLQAFEQVNFAGITGMTSLNGKHALLSVLPGSNQVTVALDTAQNYAGGGTWARVAPHNLTGLMRVIWRAVGTNTDYKRVAEIPATTTTYNDTIAPTALGETIETVDSGTPPKNLHSLVALANGALAGIAGNELCFSEQYKPYSWPVANRYAFSGVGVALCAAGNSVIVLTDTYPVVATATVPEAVSLARMPVYAPCIAKRGAVDVGGGCVFPSHDGLYMATPSDVRNITDGLYRFDEWQTRKPETFKAAYFDQKYYAMHDTPAGETARIMVLDLAEPDSIVEIDERVDTLYANPWDGRLYVGQGNTILEWDADDANRFLMFWESREYQIGPPLNFSCAQVHAKYDDIVPVDESIEAANLLILQNADNLEGALGSTVLGMLPLGASNLLDAIAVTAKRVQFSMLRDGDVVYTKELSSSEPFRLPAGKLSEVYAMQVTSSIPVYSMTMAQGMAELAQAST